MLGSNAVIAKMQEPLFSQEQMKLGNSVAGRRHSIPVKIPKNLKKNCNIIGNKEFVPTDV